MAYKQIKKKEGEESLKKILTFRFSPDDTNPFGSNEPRFRAFFLKNKKENNRQEVLFCLSKEEVEHMNISQKIGKGVYLFGLFGYNIFCHIKSEGVLFKMGKAEQKIFLNLIKNRFSGTSLDWPTGWEIEDVLRRKEYILSILNSKDSSFFKFVPKRYFSHVS